MLNLNKERMREEGEVKEERGKERGDEMSERERDRRKERKRERKKEIEREREREFLMEKKFPDQHTSTISAHQQFAIDTSFYSIGTSVFLRTPA